MGHAYTPALFLCQGDSAAGAGLYGKIPTDPFRSACGAGCFAVADGAAGLRHEIQQILHDLKFEGKIKIEWN